MCFVCEIGRGYGIWNENTWSVSQHSYYKQSSCPSISTCPVCTGIQGLYFPWPLGAVGYQVREGCTEPLIPCPMRSHCRCLGTWKELQTRWERVCGAQLSVFLSFSLLSFFPQIMRDHVATHCRQVTSRFCWVRFVLSMARNWHTLPDHPPPPPGPEVQVTAESPCHSKTVVPMLYISAASPASRGSIATPIMQMGRLSSLWCELCVTTTSKGRVCPFICCPISHRNDILL